MLTTASEVAREQFVFITVPPNHCPQVYIENRLQRQGGGEVNDSSDADDSDDERRWRPPMPMRPVASGAPAMTGTMATVWSSSSQVIPTPTLWD